MKICKYDNVGNFETVENIIASGFMRFRLAVFYISFFTFRNGSRNTLTNMVVSRRPKTSGGSTSLKINFAKKSRWITEGTLRGF